MPENGVNFWPFLEATLVHNFVKKSYVFSLSSLDQEEKSALSIEIEGQLSGHTGVGAKARKS